MKRNIAAAVAVLLVSAPSLASGGVPSLSGSYVLTLINNCVQSGSSVSQTTAEADFDSTAGTLSFTGFVADGNPITLVKVTGSGPYSNTKNTVTFNGTTYKAFYGAVKQGVVQYASMIAIVAGDSGNCADQLTLSHE